MDEFAHLVVAVTGGASGIGAATATMLAWTGSGTSRGRLDVLVNNAGIGAQGDVSVNDRDEWHRVLDVNVVGTARMTAAALSSARNPEAEAAALNARQPMGRLVTPEEVARAILYLASPLSSSSTGVVRRAGAVRGTRVNTRHRVTPSAAL